MLDLSQDGMAIGGEGILAGPDAVDDFDSGVVAIGMDADQPAARPQRAGQRAQHFRGLEFEAGAGAIGLRGDDEIVIRHHPSRPRHDRIEQERMVLAP
jgi:hypothetical protein